MTTESEAAVAQPISTELPLRSQPNDSTFDIVATYRDLLASDPDLTKPVAAIESLIALLNTVPSTTVYETLDTVKTHSDLLKASVENPLPLQAGTDLFLQYLVASLKQQDGSFDAVRQHLLRNGRLFATRAIAARNGIAEAGWRFVREGKCVLTHGASRSVTGLLERAAKNSEGKFRVVYVRDEVRAEESDGDNAMMVRPVKASSLTLLCLRARFVRQMATKSTTSITASARAEPMPKIAFISGPLDPSPTYFQEHYARLIDDALDQGHHFVLATSRGIDTLARNYLINHPTTPAAASRISLFLSEPEKKFRTRYAAFEKAGGRIVVAGGNHTARDEALTRASHYDILRYNTKEECKALYGLKYRERVSGTEKNEIRRASGVGLVWGE